ncbi:hypothetical protein T4E_127, partial [Trichinella pseudospiralis]
MQGSLRRIVYEQKTVQQNGWAVGIQRITARGNRRTYKGCSSGFGDKLLNKSSLIRVTAAPVSSRSWESVPATLVCTKIDDGLVKATTCTASCWERPVRGVGNCLDWGPLGTLPMLRAGRFPGDEVGS